MRPLRLVFVVLAALFVIAGWSRLASAAESESSTSHDSERARPGTYAAQHGAPLCDPRAASVFAADPRPADVDDHVAVAAKKEGCRDVSAEKAAPRAPNDRDDLQRTPPSPRESALCPRLVVFPRLRVVSPRYERVTIDGARDPFLEADRRPPRS